MSRLEEIYYEAKADKWLKRFAVFCRVALAVAFLIAGFVKIMGERFAAGLPSNNPLGHYFDALYITGYYYTFIGIGQVIIAILILIPRTSLLGALMYFPVIINILVLTYATRFDGTREVTMMALANLFLLVWDYDRLKHILPFKQPETDAPVVKKPLGVRLRIIFFGGSFAIVAFIIAGTFYLFEIVPGNSEAECINQCATSKNPAACKVFCDCIYKQGKPLDSCLAAFNKAKDLRKVDGK
ncbi:DoxX family protein [Mucilaginibacter gilvus]|uniref:DoxX family protein n=1 Tax=Mucilaginibacter gilvus TaxID=2305909 RepID=A0A3S3YQD7_9SPHI|nr:DoxX family protein [Mucilaginibacter gilvus]RWY48008.1 DoxX family protein [Mucilaginibacter gilvus]